MKIISSCFTFYHSTRHYHARAWEMIQKINTFIISNITENNIFIKNIIQRHKLLPSSDSADTKARFFKIVIEEITFKARANATAIIIAKTTSTALTALPRTRTAITYSTNTIITLRVMPTYQNYHPPIGLYKSGNRDKTDAISSQLSQIRSNCERSQDIKPIRSR